MEEGQVAESKKRVRKSTPRGNVGPPVIGQTFNCAWLGVPIMHAIVPRCLGSKLAFRNLACAAAYIRDKHEGKKADEVLSALAAEYNQPEPLPLPPNKREDLNLYGGTMDFPTWGGDVMAMGDNHAVLHGVTVATWQEHNKKNSRKKVKADEVLVLPPGVHTIAPNGKITSAAFIDGKCDAKEQHTAGKMLKKVASKLHEGKHHSGLGKGCLVFGANIEGPSEQPRNERASALAESDIYGTAFIVVTHSKGGLKVPK